MIPIVIGGTPVSRFWVIGGVDAMMNGYPWVVQLKYVVAELLKIMPPEVTRPPGGEEPQPMHGPYCGGTVINSRLAFLNPNTEGVLGPHRTEGGGTLLCPPPGKCSINGPNELKFCV